MRVLPFFYGLPTEEKPGLPPFCGELPSSILGRVRLQSMYFHLLGRGCVAHTTAYPENNYFLLSKIYGTRMQPYFVV